MEWDKFWALFHKTWGESKESPEYNKKNWCEMQSMLMSHKEDMENLVDEFKIMGSKL